MFKYKISYFAVIVCLLHCICASSIAKREVQSEPVSNDIQQTAKKVIEGLESSVKTTARYFEWVVNAVQELSKNLVHDVGINIQAFIISAALRIELFSMADGSHFTFPTNDKLDKEHQVISITVTEMFLNLEFMEKMDQIITNSSDATVSHYFPHKITYISSMSNVLDYFLKKIVEDVNSDSELNKKFSQLKAEVKQRALPQLGNLNAAAASKTDVEKWELYKKWFYSTSIRSLLLTRYFVQHGTKDFSMIFSEEVFNRYTLVRSIFKLASVSNNKLEKLQNVYDHALKKAAEKWNIYDLDFTVNKNLFASLTEALENQPTLNAEIPALQKDLARSTHFDKDMLTIHLLPF